MRSREDILADLLAEVLDDPASLDAPGRRAAAANRGAPAAVAALAAKIHAGAWSVTDEDVAAARNAGLSEDQVFDAIVSASIGAAKKRLDAGMAAVVAAHIVPRVPEGGP